jgi:hypothetical protein
MSEQEYGYSSEGSGPDGQTSEAHDEDVAIDIEPTANEQVEVSIDDLMADGYELPPDDQQYIA